MAKKGNSGKRKKPAIFSRRMKKKLLVVFALVVLALGGLIGRLYYIEAYKGDEYEKNILSQQGYESQNIPYQRGEILDSKGTILANSVDVYNVILDCKAINEETKENDQTVKKYVDHTVKALVQCFPDVTEEEVRAALTEKADSRYFVLRKQLKYDEIQEFQDLESKLDDKGKKVNPNIQGVWFEKEYVREYPYNSLASKVIGFITSGNEGIGGLEDYYNDTLNGVDGRQYGYLNADNNYEQTIKEPINGKSLITTIDINIQKVIEEEIASFQAEHQDGVEKGEGSKHAAVLVMNPGNGEILGLSDNNTYDLNDPWNLSKYYTEAEEKALSEEERLNKLNEIWQNYCITYTYEPGSTAKPFTVATALEVGKIRDSYLCDGVEEIGGHEIHCVQRSGHGSLTAEQAVMESCNDALMRMAADIGKDDFYKYQNIFNFGLRTNIDLPGESRTDTLIYTAENTNTTSLATNAFGQNFNVTMVQLASAFSSLINGGYYYQPHLVKKIIDDNGNTVQEFGTTELKQTISKQTSDTIKGYLYSTVSKGTGKSAKVPGYSMGGKTGTAQKGKRDEKKYIVSFIGFAPVDNPQVVVYAVIDEANVPLEEQSSALATDLAKKVFTRIFPYMNIFQDEPIEEDDENPTGETGDDTAGETGENPAGGNPTGENPTGEDGENPTGENPAGENPTGEDGENPAGENPTGENPAGGNPTGEDGENPAGGNPTGENPTGEGGENPTGGSPDGDGIGGDTMPVQPGGPEYPSEGAPEAMPQ